MHCKVNYKGRAGVHYLDKCLSEAGLFWNMSVWGSSEDLGSFSL